MKNITVPVKVDGSMEYARFELSLYEESRELALKKRPLVLVIPGGGYGFTSAREADSIANNYLAIGYHAAILYYSVSPAVYPTSLRELAFCVKYLKDKADELLIDETRIILCGFSAGAHLAALFGTGYFRPEVTDYFKVSKDYLKPAGMILAYPVITSGEYAHRGSFDNLLGPDKNNPEMLKYVSIENRVDENTPPAFIWHTFEDGAVPLENSLFMAKAMRAAKIPFEYHVFPRGGHGLSLAGPATYSQGRHEDDPGVRQWMELSQNWLLRTFGLLNY